MTAVIGILNKQGVALAADSAVTVIGGNNKKIYNTANKIFTLSKYHPIGIMVYGSSSFMNTPWEIIIKLYRKEIGDKSFNTVKEYKNDFIKFLKKKNFFTSKKGQQNFIKQFIYYNLSAQKELIIQKLEGQTDDENELLKEFQEKYKFELEQIIDSYKDKKNLLKDFSKYTFENFMTFIGKELNDIIKIVYEGIELTDELNELIKKQYYCILTSKKFIGSNSGLVFSGFGEKEIYPSIISINVAEAFDDILRYYNYNEAEISDSNNGSIMPYAQKDVIDMFITGIDPEIDKTYFNIFQETLTKYHSFIAESIKEIDVKISEKIKSLNIDHISSEFIKEMNNVKIKLQINPTVETVSILSKEYLAEMPESLIYLTYLKRRISSDEESVGGPIDVAIISKGDGFIWKKRKHYFSQELNRHFMANYFNK